MPFATAWPVKDDAVGNSFTVSTVPGAPGTLPLRGRVCHGLHRGDPPLLLPWTRSRREAPGAEGALDYGRRRHRRTGLGEWGALPTAANTPWQTASVAPRLAWRPPDGPRMPPPLSRHRFLWTPPNPFSTDAKPAHRPRRLAERGGGTGADDGGSRDGMDAARLSATTMRHRARDHRQAKGGHRGLRAARPERNNGS